jgi:hypothetical protein
MERFAFGLQLSQIPASTFPLSFEPDCAAPVAGSRLEICRSFRLAGSKSGDTSRRIRAANLIQLDALMCLRA